VIVALDACSVIYLVEGGTPLGESTRKRVRELLAERTALALCSRLAWLECLVVPIRTKDEALVQRYQAFFRRRRVRVAGISTAVVERATALRAHHGFKTPDAVHLATAIDRGADLFLTGDQRLAGCPGLRVEVVAAPAATTP